MPKRKGKDLPANPHIRIIVRGLVLCNAQQQRIHPAEIGMLDIVDESNPNQKHHKKEITVIKTVGRPPSPPIPDVDVQFNCRLSIADKTGPLKPDIILHQPIQKFVRSNPPGNDDESHDFRWIPSMEETTGKSTPELAIYRDALSPIISIDRGTFYTYEIATVEADLEGFRKRRSAFGHIADSIGIDIELPANSTAIFTNETQKPGIFREIFRLNASSSDQYLILIDRDCNQHDGSKCRSDFSQIYKAIKKSNGDPLDPGDKKDIRARLAKNDPEIPCLGGRIG